MLETKRVGGRVRGLLGGGLRFSLMCSIVAFAACDRLMDVELPGQLLEENLDDPRLAGTLARGAESDFECAFGAYLFTTSLWTSDFFYTDQQLENQHYNQRNVSVKTYPEGTCTSNSIWLPLNISRVQGESVVKRVMDWPEKAVENRDYVLAKSYAYAGYSYLLLGEAMCEVAFDKGPAEPREAAWELAVDRLTQALQYATSSSHSDASSLANMARVGLARAYLNLGQAAQVVQYASSVPMDFVRYVSASSTTGRRYNRIYSSNGANYQFSLASTYWNLTVDGVPDPRVPAEDGGGAIGFDGLTPIWYQMKYPGRDTPMPFATGREAQLMIAEVSGGQEAVNIINTLRSTWNLPEFSSTDAQEIRDQVIEERRRELWLQGTRLGDMLRLNIPFPTGKLPRLTNYGDLECIPLPDEEVLNNPNLSG